MLEKRKTPWKPIFLSLLGVEIITYYIAGLYGMDGVTLTDYGRYLRFIFLHPFRNYYTDVTLAAMSLSLTLWLMAVSYFLNYYRDFHFGQEMGTADWEDLKVAVKKLAPKSEKELSTPLTRNITIGSGAVSNDNMLIIGASGSYKSTSVITPNILEANCTNVILDIKGDLLKKYGHYLKSIGVAVKVLNFRDFAQSDRYNPFRYVKTEEDMISLITSLQHAVERPDRMKGDPFWDDGLCLYLQSIFYLEWFKAKEEHRLATMNNILNYANMESRKDGNGVSELQKLLKEEEKAHGPDYPPVRDYKKLKDGAADTVRSIIIMVNAQFRLFDLPGIRRIFEADDIDIPSLGLGVNQDGKTKTALFLVMSSGDSTYNMFINLFYFQLFYVLKNVADHLPAERLPIHVRLWADEFYAGPKPMDTEVLLGEIRSRNMSIVPALQDLAQIKAVFPNEKWEIFNGNCAAVIYLGSGPTAKTTHQWISEMLNKTTIDSRSENISGGWNKNGSMQMSRIGVSLMTEDQVREIPKDCCILFADGCKPIFDHKNIPWIVGNPRFEEAQRLNKVKGNYVHPVRTIYNEETRTYKTIECGSRMIPIGKEELDFYKGLQEKNPKVKVYEFAEEDFLYLNLTTEEEPTEEDIREMVEEAKYFKKDLKWQAPPADVKEAQAEQEKIRRKEEMRKEWNLSGSLTECLLRYASELDPEEKTVVMEAMQTGFTESKVKELLRCAGAESMRERWQKERRKVSLLGVLQEFGGEEFVLTVPVEAEADVLAGRRMEGGDEDE